MEVIFEGSLCNGQETFYVIPLSIIHIEKILDLQEIVIDALEDRDMLQPLSREEFAYILNGNGLMIGAFLDEKLIAFRALLVPVIDEEHLGLDIGLAEEDLKKVIYQEISNVHPTYRGNRLQQTLATLIMKELARKKLAYSYLCCTVAPYNIPSLKDKFAQGMHIAALKEKYGGRLRYIFTKKIDEPCEKSLDEKVKLNIKDIKGQQELLAFNWKGTGMEVQNGEYWIEYSRIGK
ncbi:GNAT family N-acetyltransferase [Heyndrickxia oleronia]|jgi:hypothetical protein|uniref:GNAT family N-acetyltransferase n=1 Tax=Heyndrickxia oleronia TaxID=38875 RepID=UPI0024311422|nr:GNAT family N-acetyltransferase [Heyndrickxia oleronia]MCI1591437.1 GNAT family N-acetyltransferase [Heyndrickxia oleronia]MCI1612188.1 GNAT family N-acetyltransferase [Heyndrickxia oleronia]MCI1745654.1 GNAT family N-acetyltransferase [Heyndrickxia oleronia]MCI1762768.1 GNAT family N-acetyltransferase [Heyndrickxia oleronia]